MKKNIFFFSLLLCFSSFSQEVKDSVVTDTSAHSVRKAVIFSSILPCSGQFYNHFAMKPGTRSRYNIYWKSPLFLGGIGTTGYLVIKNQVIIQSIKEEYKNRLDTNFPTENLNPTWKLYSNTNLVNEYHKYLNKRDFAIIGTLLIYAYQIIDAGVEAHFVSFDISRDLSLRVQPNVLYSSINKNTIPALSFSINFR